MRRAAFFAPGFESAVARLVAGFRAARWPEAPPGFAPLGDARPMRALYRGTISGPGGALGVVVKRSRARTLADRVAGWFGGKAGREGRALCALAARDVRVPRVIGWSADGVLVLEEVGGLRPLPDPSRATPAERRAVAELLARAHAAGLVHRDLTRANLAWADGQPVLLDLGGARVARPLSGRRLVEALARARNALLGEASRADRLRALRTYAEAAGRPEVEGLAREVEARAGALARAYRVGRDRRARRTGTRYETFATATGRGVRTRATEHRRQWVARLAELRDGEPRVATPLKPDGRVVRTRWEGRGVDVVVKRFARAPRVVPRAIRCFRAAVALRHRFVATPAPLLAASFRDGRGLLVTEHVDAPDLRTALAGDAGLRVATLCAVGRALRRMHDAGVRHRDLKAQNLLVRRDAAGGVEVLVADVEGVATSRRRVGWRRRARDLGRLDASLDLAPAERAAWIDAYRDVLPFPPVSREAFDGRIASRAAWKRRRKGRVG